MRFKLSEAKIWNTDEEKRELERYGFKFSYDKHEEWSDEVWYREEDGFIDISSLEELLDFVKKWGDIVLSEDKIIIYNDYLE